MHAAAQNAQMVLNDVWQNWTEIHINATINGAKLIT